MIDRSLNYGRHIIRHFAEQIYKAGGEGTREILDIGAGGGNDLLIYKGILADSNLHALEGYEPNIKKLQELGINTHKHDLEKDKFPFSNESLDLISANQILEHTKEIFWILHEISRVLKVGGYFVMAVPNLASFHNRLLLLVGKQPTSIQNHSAHVRGYTKGDMLKFMRIFGGYELLGFKGSNFYPFPPLLAKPLATALPNMAYSIFFLFKKARVYEGEFVKWPVQKELETNFYLGGGLIYICIP